MNVKDGRGLATSSHSEEAVKLLDLALTQLLRYERDPIAITTDSLAADPDFIMGYCFRAYLNMFSMDPTRHAKAGADLVRAAQLAADATPRERAHLNAATQWFEGEWAGATTTWGTILLDQPHDLFALKAAYLADFYQGRGPRMRDRVAASLFGFPPDDPLYGYLLGMLAFGLEECGDYERAEETGRRAVALNPDDVWAVHAVAHVYEMRGHFARGIRWLREHESNWSGTNNFFSIHNWWHLALYYMELNQYDRVLEIYDGPVRGEQSELVMDLEDASSMLWRAGLFKADTRQRWDELADLWQPHAESAHYSFNDVHAMMAFVGAGRTREIEVLLGAMTRRSKGHHTHAQVIREVGLPMCRGLAAFGRKAYGETVARLMPIRYEHRQMGGSHAQRDVLVWTLIEAALRDGQFALARSLIAQRITLRPEAPGNWRKLARALDGLGDHEGADGARTRMNRLMAAED